MRKFIRIAVINLSILLILCMTIFAQTEERRLDISGQIRMRSEVDGKDFTKDTDPYDYTLLRSRLNLKFSYSDKLIAFA